MAAKKTSRRPAPPTRAELVDKPVLRMREAAIVAGLSVKATRKLVELWAHTEPTLIDRSGGRRGSGVERRIRTAPLLRVVGDTREGIIERTIVKAEIRELKEDGREIRDWLRRVDRRLLVLERALRDLGTRPAASVNDPQRPATTKSAAVK